MCDIFIFLNYFLNKIFIYMSVYTYKGDKKETFIIFLRQFISKYSSEL